MDPIDLGSSVPGTPEPHGPVSSTGPRMNPDGPASPAPRLPAQDGDDASNPVLAAARLGPATFLPPVSHSRGLGSLLLTIGGFVFVVLLTLYALPHVLAHWRTVEAESAAEATYLHRQAELKAEAEAADRMLNGMDRRVTLTSLGFREVVRKVMPIVVNVTNYRKQRDIRLKSRKPNHFHDPDDGRDYQQAGVGSGLIVSPGQILTNHHVVKDAHRLRISFASGRSVGVNPSAIVADPLTDLAVIRLSGRHADHNNHAEFADSDRDVQAGDWALAVGSPLGLKQTVTQGVISAKGRLLHIPTGDFPSQRRDQFLIELLQTDAAINPGNSGGPLFDHLGRVVGINVAIASETGRNQGIGFAIPSNQARKIFEQLVRQGEVARGFLGVGLEELPEKKAQALGLVDAGGVHVAHVLPGQAGEKASLQAGDVILRYQNRGFDKDGAVAQLRQWVLETDPGAQVAVEIIRAGKHRTLTIEIGKRSSASP
ncbi:MAG: trypsin-like serine protease [Planctomycetes bacterium]|nr:trypsin-like serine protease [Planctomycetota bacterium]